MAWIKFDHATLDKPEVLKMADLLETSADDVIGKLLRVWVWFDQQSLDGNAGGVTYVTLSKHIDRLVHSQGFAGAMKSVGWLTDSGIPHFERHNGESAKNRALTSTRVGKHRASNGNGAGVTSALPEKIREDIKPNGASAASKSKPRWWDTEAGMLIEGKRRGIEPRPGEPWPKFKDRIFQTREPA